MKHLTMALAIAGLLLGAGASGAPGGRGRPTGAKRRIVILNLLNGLELSEDQTRSILDAAREAEKVRERARSLIEEQERDTAGVFDEIERRIRKGPAVIPPSLARGVHRRAEETDFIRADARDSLDRLADEVLSLLEPHQIHVLDGYKPCIIPPLEKGLYGQADDSRAFGRMLERIRNMPERVYRMRRDAVVERAIIRAKAKAPGNGRLDEEEMRKRLLEEMDRVRAMSDMEYFEEKEAIAGNLKDMLAPRRPPIDSVEKIKRFLLAREAIPLLENRLSAAREGG